MRDGMLRSTSRLISLMLFASGEACTCQSPYPYCLEASSGAGYYCYGQDSSEGGAFCNGGHCSHDCSCSGTDGVCYGYACEGTCQDTACSSSADTALGGLGLSALTFILLLALLWLLCRDSDSPKSKGKQKGKVDDVVEEHDDAHLALGMTLTGLTAFLKIINWPQAYMERKGDGGFAAVRAEKDWIGTGLKEGQLTGYDLCEAIKFWIKENGYESLSVCEALKQNGHKHPVPGAQLPEGKDAKEFWVKFWHKHVRPAELFYSHLQKLSPNQTVRTLAWCVSNESSWNPRRWKPWATYKDLKELVMSNCTSQSDLDSMNEKLSCFRDWDNCCTKKRTEPPAFWIDYVVLRQVAAGSWKPAKMVELIGGMRYGTVAEVDYSAEALCSSCFDPTEGHNAKQGPEYFRSVWCLMECYATCSARKNRLCFHVKESTDEQTVDQEAVNARSDALVGLCFFLYKLISAPVRTTYATLRTLWVLKNVGQKLQKHPVSAEAANARRDEDKQLILGYIRGSKPLGSTEAERLEAFNLIVQDSLVSGIQQQKRVAVRGMSWLWWATILVIAEVSGLSQGIGGLFYYAWQGVEEVYASNLPTYNASTATAFDPYAEYVYEDITTTVTVCIPGVQCLNVTKTDDGFHCSSSLWCSFFVFLATFLLIYVACFCICKPYYGVLQCCFPVPKAIRSRLAARVELPPPTSSVMLTSAAHAPSQSESSSAASLKSDAPHKSAFSDARSSMQVTAAL